MIRATNYFVFYLKGEAMEKFWYKNYDKGVTPEVDFSKYPLVMPEVIKNAARLYGDVLAIKSEDRRITYKEFDSLTSTIAGNLRLFGIEKQDKVCVLLPNSVETILAFWSLGRAGIVGVMTNPLYSEAELIHQITDSDSKTIITTDTLLPKVKAILPEIDVKNVFVVKLGDTQIEFDDVIHPWEDLLAANRGYTCDNLDANNDLALLQYTGGTTGISKGCMLTHSNIICNAHMYEQNFMVVLKEGQEKFVGVLPYFHVYGLQISVIMPVIIGATMIPMTRFTPRALLSLISTEKITVMASAPSIFSAILAQKEIDNYDLTSMKLVISGSAPLPIALIEIFEKKTGAMISEGYGLSEASPVTHFSPLFFPSRKIGSIGLPMPSTDVKIVDVEYGVKELGVEQNGELCIRGPQVMKGYYKQPAATEEVLVDGWLHTGDIAKYDKDGFFYITDRKKDLIICGGYNVYPREIEEVLYKHPKISEACVVGIKDDVRGEAVKAFVVAKPNEQVEKREIIAFCRKNLANYKIPRDIEIRESLPKSPVGKILRRQLRDEANKA